MRRYEMMVILDPELEERTVAPALDQFLNVVRQGGGSVEKVDIWGRRKLAYEIDKKSEGIYAVVDMVCTPDAGQGARPPAQPQRGGPAHQGHSSGSPVKEPHPWRKATSRSPWSATSPTTPSCGSPPSGAAVANFTVASSTRVLDKQTNEWKDGETRLPALQRVAAVRRERRRVAPARHARDRVRPAQAAVVRDQGGREAHRRRARGRRGRPVPALRHRQGHQGQPRSGGGGSGGGLRGRPAGRRPVGHARRVRRPGGGGDTWGSPSTDEPPF